MQEGEPLSGLPEERAGVLLPQTASMFLQLHPISTSHTHTHTHTDRQTDRQTESQSVFPGMHASLVGSFVGWADQFEKVISRGKVTHHEMALLVLKDLADGTYDTHI